MTRATLHAFAIALVLVMPSTAAAQRFHPSRPGWLPPYTPEGGFPGDLTAAERAAALGVLGRIEALLLQVPGLANPQGFEIMPQVLGGGRGLIGPGDTELPGGVVSYAYSLWFFTPTMEIAGEGLTCIDVSVNFADVWGLLDQPKHFRDARGRSLLRALPGGPDPLRHAGL